jgi:hypothetical protein
LVPAAAIINLRFLRKHQPLSLFSGNRESRARFAAGSTGAIHPTRDETLLSPEVAGQISTGQSRCRCNVSERTVRKCPAKGRCPSVKYWQRIALKLESVSGSSQSRQDIREDAWLSGNQARPGSPARDGKRKPTE